MKEIQIMVDILNEALAIDPTAVQSLFMKRVATTDQMEQHRDIIVGSSVPGEKHSPPDLGFLGLLNGMVRRMLPDHRIVAHYDSNSVLFKFSWREWK